MGLQLTAGEILFQTLILNDPVAGDDNVGNGTITTAGAGVDAVIGTYTLVCVSTRAEHGIFEVRDQDNRVLGRANVGTNFTSTVLSFTINDGTTDFAVGDTFSIEITGSLTHGAYDFAADPVPPQVATAALSEDIDTTAAATEQFATARGPAIVPASALHLPLRPGGMSINTYNALFNKAAEQLSRRGIVLRGELPLVVIT
jgi:hypothetical protein